MDNGQVVGWDDITQTNLKSQLNCFPNPFSDTTKISFSIDTQSMVNISVYNISCQQLAMPFTGYCDTGEYVVEFEGGTFPCGVYLCRMQAGNRIEVKRLIRL